MRIRSWNVVFFTGFVWFAIGFFLTLKGLNRIVYGIAEGGFLCRWLGSVQQASLLLIALALIIGYAKGRFVMIKTVRRVVKHLIAQADRLKISTIYPKSYYILLSLMMALGMFCKFLPISKPFIGFIDLAVGSALINGATLYFRYGFLVRAEKAPF